VAIVGFDGIQPLIEPRWKLTTIAAHWKEVARKAVGLLVEEIEGREVPRETILPVALTLGNTT
jgi:LacI family transcriptional regulator/LacI family purine nucleotide synthesis repressor